jgi:hypothetical protein
MPGYLAMAVLVVGLALPWTRVPVAAEFSTIELSTLRPVGRGEAVEIQVTTGPLPRGARLVLMTESGEVIGAVAPLPAGSRSSRATVPISRAAMADKHLRLHLQVAGPGILPRSPNPGEVTKFELIVVPQSE